MLAHPAPGGGVSYTYARMETASKTTGPMLTLEQYIDNSTQRLLLFNVPLPHEQRLAQHRHANRDRSRHPHGRIHRLCLHPGRPLPPGPGIAARAGGVGVVNGELEPVSAPILRALDAVSATAAPYGAKLDAIDADIYPRRCARMPRGLQWLVVDARLVPAHAELVRDLRAAGVKVLAEVTTPSGWAPRSTRRSTACC